MPEFREIEHTADTGIEVWGENLNTLFLNAAKGMYSLIFNPDKIISDDYFKFSLSEENLEDLLVSFLSELNYYIFFKKVFFTQFQNINIKQKENVYYLFCSGQILNVPIEQEDQLMEIKSVTYHQLKIIRQGKNYYTRIIFDI
jgi:SHS2 domain-containing protein